MRIGEAAERAGVSARALRYYEEEGLIEPARSSGGHRMYSEAVVEQVRFIRCLQTAGLTGRTILTLLPSVDTGVTTPDMVWRLRGERDRMAAQIVSMVEARERLDDELIVNAVRCTVTDHPQPAAGRPNSR
jgi:DNA-binding transcriptional MerR regulator